MNVDPQQIASIVQAVLQQLQQAMPTAAPVAPVNLAPLATGPSTTSPVTTGPVAPVGSLQLTDRVITWELIRGRLSGIQSVEVGPRAVVTPLVRDELRRAGIRLERGGALKAAQPTAAPIAGLLVLDETRWTADAVVRGASTTWQVARGLDELLAPLRTSSGGMDRHAVVVTPRWAEVAWQVGRDTGLPTVAVHSVATLEQAWRQLQPQVLVVNSSQASLPAVQAILQAYATLVRSVTPARVR